MKERIRAAASLLGSDIRNVKWAVISIIACFLFLYLVFGSICPLVCLTGYPCPACGLTRAGLCLLTFRFGQAWEMQPFIYPAALWLLAAAWIRYGSGRRRLPDWLKAAGGAVILGMAVFYAARMWMYFPDRAPYVYHPDNLIRMIVIRR